MGAVEKDVPLILHIISIAQLVQGLKPSLPHTPTTPTSSIRTTKRRLILFPSMEVREEIFAPNKLQNKASFVLNANLKIWMTM